MLHRFIQRLWMTAKYQWWFWRDPEMNGGWAMCWQLAGITLDAWDVCDRSDEFRMRR